MPEFFSLSRKDQLEALNAVADKTGVPPHLLEKDVWVVNIHSKVCGHKHPPSATGIQCEFAGRIH